jgi:hypothetical protein
VSAPDDYTKLSGSITFNINSSGIFGSVAAATADSQLARWTGVGSRSLAFSITDTYSPQPEEPAVPEEPVTPDEPDSSAPGTPDDSASETPDSAVSDGGHSVPQTGDDTNMLPWVLLLLLAVCAAAAALRIRENYKRNGEW